MSNTHDGGPAKATESIIALDMARLRKEGEARRVLHYLERTIQVRAERPDDDEAVQRARPEFTMDSMAIVAPLIEAVDILWAIIYASDGCVGHRHCAHSMEPWQRARDLLYRNAQRADEAGQPQSPYDIMREHLDEFGK